MPWPKNARDAATHKRMSEASKARWADPKYRARLSAAQKKSWEDPEIRRSRVEPRVGQKRSAETKKKMSESRRKRRGGHTDPKLIAKMNEARRGSSNTPEQNAKISKAKTKWHEDNPELSREIMDKATKANKYFDNKLEQKMAKILDDLNIRHRKQGRVDALDDPHRHHKWDFVIKNIKLLVEVDGCYWHGCEEHASVERRRELEAHTSMQRARDRRARKVGWTVLRFWEHDMRDEAAVVRAIIGVVARAAKKVA